MTDFLQQIYQRHSVRSYKQQPLSAEHLSQLETYLESLRSESGLDVRLIQKADKVFAGFFQKVAGWKNPPPAYFVFVGKSNPQLDEKCGYFGEKLVLFAQSIGLNTCWVGLFNKAEVKAEISQPAVITIAVGYGETCGKQRKSKTAKQVARYDGDQPEWFTRGVECALLAPTAINRQGFSVKGCGNVVSVTCSPGPFATVDVGIVKLHFELGAGKENFVWEE